MLPRPGTERMGRILLVDDDPNVVDDNVVALEASGHTVTTASTTTNRLSARRMGVPLAALGGVCAASWPVASPAASQTTAGTNTS